MNKYKEALDNLRGLTVWQLVRMADCGTPDGQSSAGAVFLDSTRDATVEAIGYASEDGVFNRDTFEDNGGVHELADGAPDIYTHTRWAEFVDLAAWQEDTSDYGPSEDLTQAAGVALYVIADRLVRALLDEYQKMVDSDD